MTHVSDYLKQRGWKANDLMMLSVTNDSHRYYVYNIRQGRSGKHRQIEEPLPELKEIQKELVSLFEEYPLHPACMSKRGRSISANAVHHEGARHILRVDISKCYPSTTIDMINTAIDRGMSDSLKKTLMMQAATFYCTFKPGNIGTPILPTGAPTSPILCNIALTPIDHIMQNAAEHIGYTYTRYMDDIHLSTQSSERHWELLDWIEDSVLKPAGYKMNKKKSKWMTAMKTDEMIVTGVRLGTVNKVPREFWRMMRARLQNIAKDGKQLDAETQGCLAYIKSIDEGRFNQLLEYYERRRAYAPSS